MVKFTKASTPRVYSPAEREHRRRYMEEYRKKNPTKVKEWADRYYADKSRYLHYARNGALKMKYGITVEEYERMLAAQDGKCAICAGLPKRYRLAVDHDHQTGQVRRLLCIACNSKLAALENAEWRAKAEAYLQEFRG